MSVLPIRPRPALAGAAPAILGPTFCEAFAPRLLDAGAAGFVMGLLDTAGGGTGRPLVLWAQDGMSRREAGLPYLPGLGREILRVDLHRPVDVLAAMEDGLAARLPVVGEVYGNPPVLDFTATRRLALRAEVAGVPAWLIRHMARPEASAARQRWRITSLPSAPDPDDPLAPGDPCWRAELFRTRAGAPGEWSVTHDRTANHLRFSSLAGDGALAARGGAAGRAAGG